MTNFICDAGAGGYARQARSTSLGSAGVALRHGLHGYEGGRFLIVSNYLNPTPVIKDSQ